MLQSIDCGYLLEPPLWGGSNVVPTIYVLSKSKKNIKHFLPNIFIFYNLQSIYVEIVDVFTLRIFSANKFVLQGYL